MSLICSLKRQHLFYVLQRAQYVFLLLLGRKKTYHLFIGRQHAFHSLQRRQMLLICNSDVKLFHLLQGRQTVSFVT